MTIATRSNLWFFVYEGLNSNAINLIYQSMILNGVCPWAHFEHTQLKTLATGKLQVQYTVYDGAPKCIKRTVNSVPKIQALSERGVSADSLDWSPGECWPVCVIVNIIFDLRNSARRLFFTAHLSISLVQIDREWERKHVQDVFLFSSSWYVNIKLMDKGHWPVPYLILSKGAN